MKKPKPRKPGRKKRQQEAAPAAAKKQPIRSAPARHSPMLDLSSAMVLPMALGALAMKRS